MRLSDHLGPTTMHLECRVVGCGATFGVPVDYRLELAPPTPGQRYPGGSAVRVVLDVDATLAAEHPLRAHLDEHATNGAPPVDELPPWAELEHCDGGATCEHPECLDDARLEAQETGR